MSIASRIEAIEQHLTDDYSVLEVAGADLTNVDKNILNLKMTWQERLLYFINNGTDVVWNNWEKVTGEGETLTLNSTEEAPMKINLKGNTSQETTTGKNLLPNNQTTQTINGVTFTMNSDKSVTIKGTATANTDYYFVGTSSQYEDFGLTTGTYNFNGCTGGSEQTYMLFAVLNRNGNLYYNGSTTDSGRQMIVETGDTFRIFIRVISGTTVNKTIYPQINVGSTPLSYEPYTNGASPNPDYPQAIHVVSGDNTIKVEGKNLLPTNASYWESGHYDTSGAKTWFDTRMRVKKLVPISPSTTYYVSNALNKRLIIREYNANKKFIYNTGAIDSGNTFTTQSNTYYLGISVEITYSEYDETTSQLFMCNNNVVDKTYEPYQSASYPINLPVENLFDKDNANYVNGWIDGTTMRLNTINGNRMFYMPCKPNTTYTISRSVITSSFRTITYNSTPFPTVTSSNVDYTVGSVLKNDNGTTLTITTNANAKYLVVHYGKIEDTNLNESLATIQVEYGSKQNSYTPYGTTPIELCKIGDYQDKIAKSTGKNLFDKNSIEEGKRLGSDGLPFTDTSFDLSDYIKVDSNTQYTYSRGSNGSGSSAIAYYDSSKTFISRTMPIMDSNAREVVLTTPNNATYVRIADLKTTLDSMQFEKGSSSSSYEPYGKVWYLNKQIGKVVFDGSENWAINTSYTYNVFYRTLDNYARISNAQTTYCEYYKGIENTAGIVDFGNNYNNSIGVRTINDNIKDIYISNNSITSASDFKTWLSTHNTIVYYVLATPTYTEITDSTLISQLETVKRSYDGQTNINQDNNDLPFILDVTALKELTQ